jgi:hypothetical protein
MDQLYAQVLVKYRSNAGEMLVKCWSGREHGPAVRAGFTAHI